MPTKGSCLNLITFGSNIRTVTSITPSKAEFLLFLYYTSAGLHQIRSSNFTSACPLENPISTFSKRCKKTQQWILRPQPQEYAVVIPTKYKDRHGWADCVDGFIQVVKHTDKMHI